MYLPTTYTVALLLTVLTMLCWGSWANTQKMTGKWRFELFYFDYAFGVILCAVIAAMTFGSLNSQELTALDSFSLSGYRNWAWGFAGGVVFNLANILLVAAISIAGLSVAFPIGIGLALVIGVVWNYFLSPQGNPILLFSGSAVVVLAIIVDAIAYRWHAASKKPVVQAAEAASAAAPVNVRAKAMRKTAAPRVGKATPAKGIIISLVSGVLMGSFYPLVELGKGGDLGLAPYSIALMFAAGVFLSTFVFIGLMALMPIYGEPVQLWDYFRGSKRQHALGVLGGIIWMIGAIANFLASSTPKAIQVGPAVSYAIGQGATMVSALWGLLLWREFAGANGRVKGMLALMLVLFITGLALVSIAPLYVRD